MSSPVLREFDRQLRADVAVQLAAEGFALGEDVVPGSAIGRRTFRRCVEHEGTRSTQIIEFQIGDRSRFVGRFTVNLAVFNAGGLPESHSVPEGEPYSWDCQSDLHQRLGFFRPPRRSLLDRVLGRSPIASDYWWPQHEDARLMRGEFVEVMQLITTEGMTWLMTHTSRKAFDWALRELERRKQWKRRIKSSGILVPFETEPFQPG